MAKARFSRIGFILAAAGAAVGLGNIWKFPYITGMYGGGAFVLVYLITVAMIGFSLLAGEMFIGYKGGKDAVSSFEIIAPEGKKGWKYAGFMLFSGLIIMTFYSVVIGWIFHYIYLSLTNTLPANLDQAKETFDNLVQFSPAVATLWHLLATVFVGVVLLGGIKAGIEKANLILMPLLLTILVGLLGYAMSFDGFGKALHFMFAPDWSKINSEAIVRAVGHAFFTLSIGLGTMVTYAASMSHKQSVFKAAMWVTILDTLIALVAGVMIYSFIFQYGESPAQGPGLVFKTLPIVLTQMGTSGVIIAVIFFLALAFAGLTSAISLTEPAVEYFIQRFRFSRLKSVILNTSLYFIIGIGAILSYTKEYGSTFSIGGEPLFDALEFTTDSILLPLGGLAIAIFVGYVLKEPQREHIAKHQVNHTLYRVWLFSLRYIAPLAILFMMLNNFGVIKI
jgi:NSS family neurotransmitter:Na+ symporter